MRSTVEIQPYVADDLLARQRTAPWAHALTRADVHALVADNGPASRKRRDELMALPGFPGAARRTAAKLAALHRGNRMLNRIINDRGRFFVAQFTLDLHFRRHDEGIGLTPGRLKALCAEQGICSGTRAGALLALMQLGGYVEAAPRGKDRRYRELMPTQKLIDQQCARWRCVFADAAPLLPDAARALKMLDRPDFVEGFLRLISAHFRAGFRYNDHVPALRLFSERNGGMFVLLALFGSADPGSLESLTPIPLSISALSRDVSSSRVHVVKLLNDAEREGLLKRPQLGAVILLPPLVRGLYEFFALNYLLAAHFTRSLLDHVEQSREGTTCA